jgi:hypothetical protein
LNRKNSDHRSKPKAANGTLMAAHAANSVGAKEKIRAPSPAIRNSAHAVASAAPVSSRAVQLKKDANEAAGTVASHMATPVRTGYSFSASMYGTRSCSRPRSRSPEAYRAATSE